MEVGAETQQPAHCREWVSPLSKKPASLTRFIRPGHLPTWFGIALLKLSAQMPWRVRLGLGSTLGWLIYTFVGKRRRIVETNLNLCFPELSDRERKKRTTAVFHYTGLAFIEVFTAWKKDLSKEGNRATFIGTEHLESAIKRGKGVLMLGSHFSCLEMGVALLAWRYPSTVPMYRRQNNALFNEIMVRGRHRRYDYLIEKSDFRKSLQALRNNRILWYAVDQDYGLKHSVFAPFFGIPTATIKHVGRLASANGSTVLLSSYYYAPGGKGLTVRITPLPELPTGNNQEDAHKINRALESIVREVPEQYLWIHRRFKSRPPDDERSLYTR